MRTDQIGSAKELLVALTSALVLSVASPSLILWIRLCLVQPLGQAYCSLSRHRCVHEELALEELSEEEL